jgi:hypothetical protein
MDNQLQRLIENRIANDRLLLPDGRRRRDLSALPHRDHLALKTRVFVDYLCGRLAGGKLPANG